MSAELADWLTLLSAHGIGPAAFAAAVRCFGSPAAVLRAPAESLRRASGVGPAMARAIRETADESWARDQLIRTAGAGVSIVTLADPHYPALLKRVYAPPPLLFVKGHPNVLSHASVAIVGSRAFTPYGRETARRLASELALREIHVVSGMAIGIDTHAHRGALENNGVTVAVLGSGLDRPYPRENISLLHEIARSGAVVTEFPMGVDPEPHNFPRRNRIISGLSHGVVVVEAGKRSGALITARHALEQNRDVFAVPGPIHSGKSTGTNDLIKEGAILVQSVEDILAELPVIQYRTRARMDRVTAHLDTEQMLNDQQRPVYKALPPDGPAHIDFLAERAGMSTPETLMVLLSLELAGLVEQLSGKRFTRRYR